MHRLAQELDSARSAAHAQDHNGQVELPGQFGLESRAKLDLAAELVACVIDEYEVAVVGVEELALERGLLRLDELVVDHIVGLFHFALSFCWYLSLLFCLFSCYAY